MGLPMAATLTMAGHTVTGVDINPRVVARVNGGDCPFEEPGMADLVKEAHATGRLKAVGRPVAAEVFFLSLPTPVHHITHDADMNYVEAGAHSISEVLKPGDLVILESTSPVGATRKHCKNIVEELRPELADKVDYVFCPERAIPGNTLHEMVHNDRLIGGLTPKATQHAKEILATFCKGQLLETTAEEAEMTKLVENASRDAQIAFANELSMVCNKLGLNVWRIRELANHHPRVNIYLPSSGVGGHCIAVDPWFIIHSAPDVTPLMRAARQVNDMKPHWVAQKIKDLTPFGTVACLGLAYKPDVDDLRESPAITVVRELMHAGYTVKIVEPHIEKWEFPLTPLEDAIKQANIVVTLTGHSAFKDIPDAWLEGKHVIDACGIYHGRPNLKTYI
jgi:UDP-N-acetyl-D-mannosaminuronic acid dehydrogenase